MVIQFVNCYISKFTNNINAVFVLPTKVIPPPCAQGPRRSERRLRRLADTWLQNYKFYF